jgi:hypothetical protein
MVRGWICEGDKVHWTIVSRHKNWVTDCCITESSKASNSGIVRFTATILGWQNFKIYEGPYIEKLTFLIIAQVKKLKSLIEQGNENVFFESSLITTL